MTLFGEGLWSCLWAEGVRGKMLRILRLLYLHTPNFLRFGRHKSVIFELRKGVKEGCILSPLLSDIFFNNLVREIKALGLGHMSEALYILVALLLFADDIVVIADSPHELQQLLTALSQYAARWRFELSSSKTKVLVFNNRLSVSQSEYRYFLGDHQIEVVSEFRYLGIILHYSLSWSSMKTHLLHAATAANHRVVSMGHIRRYFTVRFIRQLFSACIRSHLEYGVAVWSPAHDSWEAAEKVQRDFLKTVLYLPNNTSSIALLVELAMWPLHLRRWMLRLRFLWTLFHANTACFHYLIAMQQATMIAVGCAKEDLDIWFQETVTVMETVGLSDYLQDSAIILRQCTSSHWEGVVLRSLRTWFQLQCQIAISQQSSLNWYANNVLNINNFENMPTCIQSYLVDEGLLICDIRKILRIRLAVSSLLVDLGRYRALSRDDRICRLCGVAIESFGHLLVCPELSECRALLFDQLQLIRPGFDPIYHLPYTVNYLLCNTVMPRGQYARLIVVVNRFLGHCYSKFNHCDHPPIMVIPSSLDSASETSTESD